MDDSAELASRTRRHAEIRIEKMDRAIRRLNRLTKRTSRSWNAFVTTGKVGKSFKAEIDELRKHSQLLSRLHRDLEDAGGICNRVLGQSRQNEEHVIVPAGQLVPVRVL